VRRNVAAGRSRAKASSVGQALASSAKRLAERLRKYAGRDDVPVLALPRGGVPVRSRSRRRFEAPLDVFLVRKLGVPG
jgi:putative phosphoribosyl transferase